MVLLAVSSGILYSLLAFLSLADFLLSGRIFQVPKLGTKLKQDSMPLSYTPRKFITHPGNHYFYMIEGDHRVMGEGAADTRLQVLVGKLIYFLHVPNVQLIPFPSSANKEKRLILKSSIYQLIFLVDPRRQRGLGVHVSESLTPLKQKLLQLFLLKTTKQLSHLQSFHSQLGAENSIWLLVRQRIL